MLLNRIILKIKNPSDFCVALLHRTSMLWSDKIFLMIKFRLIMREKLDLNNPRTFNQKLQWLKLYNRKPEYTTMVDKYAVKEYVAKKIGDEYIIPSLGVWNTADEIDWNTLPNKFVIKTTNGGGGGGVAICKDKASFNVAKAYEKLQRSLDGDIYKNYREWPYKNVSHKIIAEELLEEPNKISPDDYKIMCFDGKVKLIEYHVGRYSEHHTQDFYDRDWNKTAITQGAYGEFSEEAAPRPALLEEMIRLSEILAEGIPHCRVDWYLVNNKLYFGEITFFDGSGLCPFDKYEDDLLLGSWITLPEKTV